MRIFLSLPFSEQLYPEVDALRNEFSELPVRWLKNSNLHVTLVPPWEIADEELLELLAKLDQVETPQPFTAEFNKFSSGPNLKAPRLLWATGPKAPTELLRLKNDLERLVSYRPDRAFTLHATLARFNRDALNASAKLSNISKTLHWRMLINEFALMKSELRSDGAEYTIIQRFSFHE